MSEPKFPSQIKYIVGNEACERFSYYGMRSILVVFMTTHLAMTESHSEFVYHNFASAVYLLPLLGAYIADKFWGKYNTILYISLFYCLGHLTLALWDNTAGLYAGLALIAFGAGGIKPCVAAYGGDQFNDTNKSLIKRYYDWFYFSINFGSFFSTLLIPWMLVTVGSGWAFGLPGILMGIATLIFWSGRKQYVNAPPAAKSGAIGLMPVVNYAFKNRAKKKPGQSFLDVAREKFTEEQVESAKAAASLFKVFFTVSIFWSLYDQQGSSWVLQGQKLDPNVLGFKVQAAQLQAANPTMVMIMIPLFAYVVYPMIEKMGFKLSALRKMGAGMVVAALSFVSLGFIQHLLDIGQTPSIAWQFVPYLFITAAEVMVSIPGLEFAYTQAPRNMKSTIQSFWLLTIFFGNQLVAWTAKVNVFQGSAFFYFFAILMIVITGFFILGAIRYKVRDFLEDGSLVATT